MIRSCQNFLNKITEIDCEVGRQRVNDEDVACGGECVTILLQHKHTLGTVVTGGNED